MKLDVYLRFRGTALKAMEFYRQVFQTEFVGPVLIDPTTNRLINACLDVGGVLISASDVEDEISTVLSSISLVVKVETHEEAERIFEQLATAGKVLVPLAPQDWGDEWGQVMDGFGITWEILVPGQMNDNV
ncbi:VOC family protein [Streptococcus himalayensis]|uniref:VOC family protein n=1 Tax=Streptococcus himalayensis TaxID=1888195 RepID=A0A917A6P7_9STRE|nr:VOC family protein [Streptococcus himalayensis]GGE31537.1 VOC family protein [Streptococcus himalayensis]